jgi:hypothetical protein
MTRLRNIHAENPNARTLSNLEGGPNPLARLFEDQTQYHRQSPADLSKRLEQTGNVDSNNLPQPRVWGASLRQLIPFSLCLAAFGILGLGISLLLLSSENLTESKLVPESPKRDRSNPLPSRE